MSVEQQIFGLQIPVDNVAGVQIVEGFDDAGRVEAGRRLLEVTAVAQNRPHFTTQTHFHQHVDEFGVAVCVVQSADEDFAFVKSVFYLFLQQVLMAVGKS